MKICPELQDLSPHFSVVDDLLDDSDEHRMPLIEKCAKRKYLNSNVQYVFWCLVTLV